MKHWPLGYFLMIGGAFLLIVWQAMGAPNFKNARKEFQTKLTRQERTTRSVVAAPPEIFRTVHYDAPPGKLAAYVSPDPGDGKKHPAIIWITGGDCNTIDEVWKDAPSRNDQTAAQYRKAGIIMMFPSLRGGSNNPGVKEGFLGEVDDVLAAAEYLRSQPYVDPDHIYLGGHSTGGTLVLLVAAASETQFRGVFSLGPVDEIVWYGPKFLPFDTSNLRELAFRSPVRWLRSIKTPVFVMEGTAGNASSLTALMRAASNPKLTFIWVKGADHFSHLARTNRLIAEKILHDKGATTNITITEGELALN